MLKNSPHSKRNRIAIIVLIILLVLSALAAISIIFYQTYFNLSPQSFSNNGYRYTVEFIKEADVTEIDKLQALIKTQGSDQITLGINPSTTTQTQLNCTTNVIATIESGDAKGFNLCNASSNSSTNLLNAVNFQKNGVWHTAVLFAVNPNNTGQKAVNIPLSQRTIKEIFNSIQVQKQ